MMRAARVFAAVATIVLAAGIHAQERKDQNRPSGTSLDNDFLLKAHAANNAEIEYSKLVEKRAASPKVKEFGQQMLQGHRQAQEALGRLFRDRKIASVAGAEKGVRDEVDRLSKLEGAEFDREYMKRMVEDHEKSVALFEGQARDGKDTAITTWAKEMLSTLKKHQQMAKDVFASVGK